MVASTHKIVGGTTGLALGLSAGIPLPLAVGAAGVAVISSTLPDRLEKILRTPHRRHTHYPSLQLLALSLIAVGVASLSPLPAGLILVVIGSVAIGCLMHSVADAMTIHPDGIALLWPISRRGIHLLPRMARVKVGRESRSEAVFAFGWSAIALAFVLCYTYARFRHHIPD